MSGPIVITVSRHVEAPPNVAYAAWLDANCARNWLFATPDGEMVRYEIDPHVGGEFVLTDRRDDVDVVHHGEFLELDRPHHLAFSFSVDGSEPTRVDVDIRATEGGCEVTLTTELHAEWAHYADRTREGWGKILEGLANEVE
jgi:uncharacterized protein YndB with AHSA1/START domain